MPEQAKKITQNNNKYLYHDEFGKLNRSDKIILSRITPEGSCFKNDQRNKKKAQGKKKRQRNKGARLLRCI